MNSTARGVSLIEALVALAVMAFGMLSMVGVQGTMRLNSDTAKQRTEAMRIASEDIERLRAFSALLTADKQSADDLAYDEVVSKTVNSYPSPNAIGNASYRVVRTVNQVPGVPQKVVTVQVSWTDRSNTTQSVTLDSAISGTDPRLGGLLALQVRGTASNQRNSRHVSIPLDAVDVSGGRSRFEPPGASGLAWYFNNMSGTMEICNAAGSGCVPATMLSGSVAYHLPLNPANPLAGDAAENPQGPALNLSAGPNSLRLDSPVDSGSVASCYARQYTPPELTLRSTINYFCAIRAQFPAGWGGQLNPRPESSPDVPVKFLNSISNYRSCRYTSGTGANGDFVINVNHPKTYCKEVAGASVPCTGKRVTGNLINQNFLIIRGDLACPADDASTPLINGHTQPHEP